MSRHSLTERERQVLDAVIRSYVQTAEPAGSRTIAKRFRLGVSAATIRNTMSDLEDRGYLYHPHTSAGRVPTDLAYRVYVDRLMEPSRLTQTQQDTLNRELRNHVPAIETILDSAAKVLGVLTHELGFAVAPSFEDAILERLQLVSVASNRILMVLVLKSGVARTIFVEVSSDLPTDAVDKLAPVLNERLSGLSLREIRTTLRDRLRDFEVPRDGHELFNIFVEEADHIFDVSSRTGEPPVVLGSAQMLAEQPEFSSNEKMRDLLELTERRDVLTRVLRSRHQQGVTVTIGEEHPDPKLRSLTLVTSTYNHDGLRGILGVMGPTRMPYEKIISIVEHTSRLIGDLHR